ncbi:hypothetical protein KFL_017490010, partial [Klebsormidium nitens]
MNLVTASRDEKEPFAVVLIASTTPAASASLHDTLAAGQAVRSCAAVHFEGPAPVFGDIRTVPAAVPPPLPNAGGVRGGRPSYAAKQGAADFAIDYGLAFSLRPTGAFARGGFGSTCIGRTCGGKGAVYARGSEPFIWERKRNRGGALICRGGGGHLLCLRCVEAQYEEGSPFLSSATGGPVPQEELFTKYEVFPKTKELHEVVRLGEVGSEGGYQFFVQRRDLAACPYCRESKTAAPARHGVKRALEEGPSPRELGTVTVLSELRRSKIPPIAVAPGLFLLPLLDVPSGRLLDIAATDRGLSNVPRLVKVDHMGSFRCLCGQKACRDHEVGFLEATRSVSGWWQGGEAIFTAFDESRPFVREVTSGVPWVLPLEQGGCVGGALFGLDAEAWKGGPQLRAIVVNNPGEEPVVCVLWGENAHCSGVDCTGSERCRHLLRVLSKQSVPLIERAADGGGSEATRTLAERRAERVEQREAGTRRLLVCNNPACRRPDSKAACTHREALEHWQCLPAAALDMGHSHKRLTR